MQQLRDNRKKLAIMDDIHDVLFKMNNDELGRFCDWLVNQQQVGGKLWSGDDEPKG